MDHIHSAEGAGPSTPTSDETSTAGTVRGLRDQEDTTQTEYEVTLGASATHPTKPDLSATVHDGRKAFATLQARAALVGVALSRIQDDRGIEVFIASKWALTKELATLAEVEQLLVRIGGQHAG